MRVRREEKKRKMSLSFLVLPVERKELDGFCSTRGPSNSTTGHQTGRAAGGTEVFSVCVYGQGLKCVIVLPDTNAAEMELTTLLVHWDRNQPKCPTRGFKT